MENVMKGIGALVVLFLVIALVGIVIALPTLLIVNYLFTATVLMAVFGIPALTFWKAFWLTILCGFLFKSTSTSK